MPANACALVVKRISQQSSELLLGVRFPPRALALAGGSEPVVILGFVAQLVDPPTGGLLRPIVILHMFSAYAIVNENNKIYIGQTSDFEKRLKRHNGILKNNSESFTSKNKGKWKLAHIEHFDTRKKAMIREKQLKSYQGRKFIRGIIESR